MKNDRQKVLTVILLAILAASIMFGIVYFNASVNSELGDSVEENMHHTVLQQQTFINNILESQISNIIAISSTISIEDTTSEFHIEYLSRMKFIHGFDSVLIADKDGNAVFADGATANIANEDYFIRTIDNAVSATEPFVSPYTQNDVICVAVPIYKDGTVIGIVAAYYTIDMLEPLLLDSINNLGEIYVLDDNGHILMSSEEDIKVSEPKFLTFEDQELQESVYSDIGERISNEIAYEINGSTQLAQYVPIDIRDWMLFYTVPQDVMAQYVGAVQHNMLVFILIISALFFVVFLYIVISRYKFTNSIRKVAYYDELTGLPNLVKFKIDISRILKEKPMDDYILVKMDIMNFKAINELFGFEMGSKVLCSIASTSKYVNEPTFHIARVGADEFLLFAGNGFFNNLGNTREAYEIIFRKLLPNLDNHKVLFRYGRYFIEPNELDIDEIISKVNMSHGNAKTTGIPILVDYDDEYKKKLLKSVEMTNKMESALNNEDFYVYLQPKCEITTGNTPAAEALVRWIEPNGNFIYPNEFIPHFEKSGFITELDKYMLDKVCKIIKSWLDKNYEPVCISVNFSRLNLENPDFVSDISEIVARNNISTKYIEIELTETAFNDESEIRIDKILEELHAAGFSVSIDDFGAGYSTLGMLKSFKVDSIKLDRSFFLNKTNDERANLVIKGIVDLSHSLGIRVVAEGVEQDHQINFLNAIGCELVQSFYYSRPIPASEFEDKYISKK